MTANTCFVSRRVGLTLDVYRKPARLAAARRRSRCVARAKKSDDGHAGKRAQPEPLGVCELNVHHRLSLS